METVEVKTKGLFLGQILKNNWDNEEKYAAEQR